MRFLFQSQVIAKFLIFIAFLLEIRSVVTEKFTTAENSALRKFRPMVVDLLYRDFMKNDNYLMPFLRARKLNVDQAKEMLQKNVEWRKRNKIDTILEEDFTEFEKEFPYVMDGVDKQGRPILIVLAGRYNIRKVVLAGRTNEFNRYLDRSFEIGRMTAQRLNATQGVMIMDLFGFNRKSQACLNCVPVFVHFTRVYENYFPALCHKFYFVNAPQVFEIIEEAIRPFQSEATKYAYNLFGHNKDEWEKVLLADINPDQLPIRFGGTKLLKNRLGSIIP